MSSDISKFDFYNSKMHCYDSLDNFTLESESTEGGIVLHRKNISNGMKYTDIRFNRDKDGNLMITRSGCVECNCNKILLHLAMRELPTQQCKVYNVIVTFEFINRLLRRVKGSKVEETYKSLKSFVIFPSCREFTKGDSSWIKDRRKANEENFKGILAYFYLPFDISNDSEFKNVPYSTVGFQPVTDPKKLGIFITDSSKPAVNRSYWLVRDKDLVCRPSDRSCEKEAVFADKGVDFVMSFKDYSGLMSCSYQPCKTMTKVHFQKRSQLNNFTTLVMSELDDIARGRWAGKLEGLLDQMFSFLIKEYLRDYWNIVILMRTRLLLPELLAEIHRLMIEEDFNYFNTIILKVKEHTDAFDTSEVDTYDCQLCMAFKLTGCQETVDFVLHTVTGHAYLYNWLLKNRKHPGLIRLFEHKKLFNGSQPIRELLTIVTKFNAMIELPKF